MSPVARDALILVVPLLGLPTATVPGFSHHLGFLRPIAMSDGFGSGVVEGLVPAIALALLIGFAVLAINRKPKTRAVAEIRLCTTD